MPLKEKLLNTFVWGFVLWFVGYVAGFLLFFVVPKESIGWIITPFATILTIWVIIKKIRRPELMCYFGLGLLWTIMAIGLDYVFLVKMFKTGSVYYKSDVYLYYALTFTLPMIVGCWKYLRKSPKAKLF